MDDSFISNNMRVAISLARRGIGHVNPNPLVGAVIVKDGTIIGGGWHQQYGGPHAERNAIADAGSENCRGADLYVTLEPCCHQGKQPPCTQAIISCGFARVFIGSSDPNPLVSGKGAAELRAAGITVYENILRNECDALNPVFFHYITTRHPYVLMKYAMTADGLTACYTGNSRWISCPESREYVHMERAECMAVMAGIGTVLKDDPLLTCRIPAERFGPAADASDPLGYQPVRQPVRIICDSSLRIPLDSNLVKSVGEGTPDGMHAPLMVVCALSESMLAQSAKARRLTELGVQLLSVPDNSARSDMARVDLALLMKLLGAQGIDSILLEGGGTLNYSALKAGIVQKIQVFIAPKIFGSGTKEPGASSVFTPVSGGGAASPGDAFVFSPPVISQIGDDVLLEYEVQNPCSQE